MQYCEKMNAEKKVLFKWKVELKALNIPPFGATASHSTANKHYF